MNLALKCCGDEAGRKQSVNCANTAAKGALFPLYGALDFFICDSCLSDRSITK